MDIAIINACLLYTSTLELLVGVMQGNTYKEGDDYVAKTGIYTHWIVYSPEEDEVVALFLDTTPVSYTHLDVYKRQVRRGEGTFAQRGFRCGRRRNQSIRTVSYTHLYERNGKSFLPAETSDSHNNGSNRSHNRLHIIIHTDNGRTKQFLCRHNAEIG